MVVPVMLAAGLLATKDLLDVQGFKGLLPVFIPGLIASAVVSYLSIRWLMRYLLRHSLYVFAAYCSALAVVVFLVRALR